MNPKTKTVIVLLLSFLLGCVIGAAFLSGTWRSLTGNTRGRANYRSHLHERLRLDSIQITRVDSLLDAYRASMGSYRDLVQESRDSLRSEIALILTEEQNDRYQEMIREMNRRDQHRWPDSRQKKEVSTKGLSHE